MQGRGLVMCVCVCVCVKKLHQRQSIKSCYKASFAPVIGNRSLSLRMQVVLFVYLPYICDAHVVLSY